MNRDNIHTLRVAYPNQSLDAALEAAQSQQLLVHSLLAVNGSAGLMGIGLGYSIVDSDFEVLVSLGGVETNETSAIQAGTATTILGTTNNDYAIVQAKMPFGLLSFNVSQAETGSPVYTYSYFDGSGYSSLSVENSVAYSATGRQCLLFAPPVDWESDANGMYTIRIQATTAPGTAVQVDSLKPCKLLAYREEVPSKGELLITFDSGRQLLLQAGQQIIPFFSFSNSSNTIEASYQISP